MVKLVVLHQASLGPVYGGRLSKYLRNQGYEISPGSLYPLLHTLEKANLLQCRIRIFKGRARKYYELTPQGQTCLEALRQEVGEIVREVILGGLPAPLKIFPRRCTARRNFPVPLTAALSFSDCPAPLLEGCQPWHRSAFPPHHPQKPIHPQVLAHLTQKSILEYLVRK